MEAHARMIVEATRHLVQPLLQCANSGQCILHPPAVLGDYFTDEMLHCMFDLYGIAPDGSGSVAIVRILVGAFEFSIRSIPTSVNESRLREIGYLVDAEGLNHRMDQEFGGLNRKIDSLIEIMIRLFPAAAAEIAGVAGQPELDPAPAPDHEVPANIPALAVPAVVRGRRNQNKK